MWSVFARSLGEQGAGGRTALAWRWALTGDCASPVTLTAMRGRPPNRQELVAEADAVAELGGRGAESGGQVTQARFVLRWLAGELDAPPLRNGGPESLHVTDGAEFAHTIAEIGEAQVRAMLAKWLHPWQPGGGGATAGDRAASGWAGGVLQFLDWVCGETDFRPLTRERTGLTRPSLYQVSLEVHRAMAELNLARGPGGEAAAARLEAMMETFAWLAGWSPAPPVDRHGCGTAEGCPERDAECRCAGTDGCLLGDCAACWRVPCVLGFGQDGLTGHA